MIDPEIELEPEFLREYGISAELSAQEQFQQLIRWYHAHQSDVEINFKMFLIILEDVIERIPALSLPSTGAFLKQLGPALFQLKFDTIGELFDRIKGFYRIISLAIYNSIPEIESLRPAFQEYEKEFHTLWQIEQIIRKTKWRANWWYRKKAKRLLLKIRPFEAKYAEMIFSSRLAFVPIAYSEDDNLLYDYASRMAAHPNNSIEYIKAVNNSLICLLTERKLEEIPPFLESHAKKVGDLLRKTGIVPLQQAFQELQEKLAQAGFTITF